LVFSAHFTVGLPGGKNWPARNSGNLHTGAALRRYGFLRLIWRIIDQFATSWGSQEQFQGSRGVAKIQQGGFILMKEAA
jgi:hypothetical protein